MNTWPSFRTALKQKATWPRDNFIVLHGLMRCLKTIALVCALLCSASTTMRLLVVGSWVSLTYCVCARACVCVFVCVCVHVCTGTQCVQHWCICTHIAKPSLGAVRGCLQMVIFNQPRLA